MADRREFLGWAIAAGGGSLFGPAVARSNETGKQSKRTQRLRMLVLGGTGFLGWYYVRAALARGHKVSVFSRGRTPAEIPPKVEVLTGDRNGDLTSISNRDWDAVIDLATFGPGWVRSLGEALHGRVRHYTFISTINVYDSPAGNDLSTDENSKLRQYKGEADPYTLTARGPQYGELKVLCEREAEKQFPGKTLILRPCYIVGPRDRVGALTYWASRLEKGGEILAAGDPLAHIHIIDVRDMARWSIDMAERSETGIFNAVGPEAPMNWGSLLKALRALYPTPAELTWVPVSWLAEHNVVNNFSTLLFWATGVSSGGTLKKNDKARAKRLVLRPLSATVEETLAWHKAQPPEDQVKVLLGVDGKQSLQDSMAREQSLLAAWHADAGDACNTVAADAAQSR